MKKHSGTILLVLIFFVGLAVMLYPTISDYINQRNQTRVVNSYAQQVDGLSDADYTAYFDAADVFNQEIAADPDALYHADHFSTYSTTLDVTGTGIMGYITIEKIGVELPIYHGTSDGVLQVAAGHLEGTSLPVGGESTHAVISAHRGLPSAKLFTNLDQLEAAAGYADNFGFAFQLRDDMLDVIGDEKTFGKPIGSDREEGKTTFVDILGLNGCQRVIEAHSESAVEALGDMEDTDFLIHLVRVLEKREQ